jgi:hypothetical protein
MVNVVAVCCVVVAAIGGGVGLVFVLLLLATLTVSVGISNAFTQSLSSCPKLTSPIYHHSRQTDRPSSRLKYQCNQSNPHPTKTTSL